MKLITLDEVEKNNEKHLLFEFECVVISNYKTVTGVLETKTKQTERFER